jgi:hypothetical protein
MNEMERLIEKLVKIQALYHGAATAGEKAAAAEAARRIQEKLDLHQPVEEFKFSFPNPWSRSLFIALLKRDNIESYRYPGQRRQTVMARMTRSYCDDELWPEFQVLNKTLTEHLNRLADEIITRAVAAGPGK